MMIMIMNMIIMIMIMIMIMNMMMIIMIMIMIMNMMMIIIIIIMNMIMNTIMIMDMIMNRTAKRGPLESAGPLGGALGDEGTRSTVRATTRTRLAGALREEEEIGGAPRERGGVRQLAPATGGQE